MTSVCRLLRRERWRNKQRAVQFKLLFYNMGAFVLSYSNVLK